MGGSRAPRETVAERRAEYDAHAWDHTVDVFQTDFDLRRPLNDSELDGLSSILDEVVAGADDQRIADALYPLVRANPDLMHPFMQIAGLTRNKILTDLRASADSRDLRIPSSPRLLSRNPEIWARAGVYLAKRLRKVMEPISEVSSTGAAFEAINQATWPHWIRQERAKRQGHQAEYRLAIMLSELNIPFTPQEKAENPMCRDAQIGGVSFDIVVPDTSAPRLVTKSTVQTSNIGQFGESKADLEVREAGEMLANEFDVESRPILLAMVDGVGFRSNIAGLEGVLENADEFCQFETLWKAGVAAAAGLGLTIDLALPSGHEHHHESFLNHYADWVTLYELDDDFRAHFENVDAGEGALALS